MPNPTTPSPYYGPLEARIQVLCAQYLAAIEAAQIVNVDDDDPPPTSAR